MCVQNPGYMKDDFYIIIETLHAAGAGDMENAHDLPAEKLKKRKVVKIDIAHDPVRDYKAEEDPKLYTSKNTARGPLTDPN